MLKRVVCLVFFLAHSAFAEPLDRVVAIINDGVITASELSTQTELLRQQIQAKKMPVPAESVLRKQVLQHLIDVDLELQLAKQNGIAITDAEVSDAIAKIAEDNHLSQAELKNALATQGLSWKSYHENLRKEILIARVQQKAVAREINVTPKQVEDYLKTAKEDKSNFTYHLQNILIPLSEKPTTEELQKAEAKAKQLLVKIKQGEDFSQLALAETSDELALEGGDLGERHLAELPPLFAEKIQTMHTNQVLGPVRTENGLHLLKLVGVGGHTEKHVFMKTHVRHILVKQDANRTSAEAKRQAQNVYQQLKAGKDFSLMAKQYSLDVSSAVKGGDLGWVSSGDLVPAFEKNMNNLPLHTISKPFKTVYGWHVVEVLERKKVDDTAGVKRQQVRQFLQQKKFAEAVHNWQQHLRANAYIKIMDKSLA